MITEENIHQFWRAVSNACDTSPMDRDRIEEYETRAMLAFAKIMDFCDDLPCDRQIKNETALGLIDYTTSNDGKRTFNIAASMPTDIYRRGVRLAQIACKQYKLA